MSSAPSFEPNLLYGAPSQPDKALSFTPIRWVAAALYLVSVVSVARLCSTRALIGSPLLPVTICRVPVLILRGGEIRCRVTRGFKLY